MNIAIFRNASNKIMTKSLDSIILICFLFLLILIATGGFSFSILNVSIQSHETKKPAIVLLVFLLFRIMIHPHNLLAEIKMLAFLNSVLQAFKKRLKGQNGFLIVAMLVGSYIVLMSLVAISRHISYNSYGHDLGIFDQMLWNTVHGNTLYTSIGGARHFFGVHVSPILLLISPLYILYAHPIALIIFQTIALASGAIPVYLLARKIINNSQLAVLFSCLYLCYEPLRNVNLFDFHEIALATPLLLFAFLYLDQRKYLTFGIFLMLAVFCKEEISIIVFIFGIYIAHFQKNKIFGYALAIAGILIFIAAVKYIIPYYRQGPLPYINRYSYLGNNIPEILRTMVCHPIYVLKHVVHPKKIQYLIEIFGPLCFLSLLSPIHMLLAVPTLLQNILSEWRPQYSIGSQYTSPLTPFVFISAIYGARNLLSNAHLKKHLNISMNDRRVVSHISVGLVLCGVLFIGKSPIYHLRQYRITNHTRDIKTLLELIPPNASVSAQESLVPHLSHRRAIYVYPDVNSAEYIALDATAVTWPMSKEEYCKGVIDMIRGTYGVIGMKDCIFVFRKNSSAVYSKEDIYSELCKECKMRECQ